MDINKGDKLYHKYIAHCKKILTNDTLFNNFKCNKDYTYMLEHVTKLLGKKYVTCLLTKYQSILGNLNWKLLSKNDEIGNPIKFEYRGLHKYTEKNSYFSPTTLRYIYIGLEILSYIKTLSNLVDKKLNILEIGGGYGGQCYILHCLAKQFNVNINSYTIIDLKYPCLIQNKYLIKLHLKEVNCFTIDDYIDKKFDFLISNYALSELSEPYQNLYINKIVKSIMHGFLIWNRLKIHNYFNKYNYNNIKILPEIPQSGKINKYILF